MGDVDLTLEVTERNFVNNDPKHPGGDDALAASDVRFAIDDFGVGFSSMEYLQRLPVRILKVDKTFVTNIEHDSNACTLMRSMVVMGEALGLDVIVEGIERWTQLEHVTFHAGATTGQGYPVRSPDAMPRDRPAVDCVDPDLAGASRCRRSRRCAVTHRRVDGHARLSWLDSADRPLASERLAG